MNMMDTKLDDALTQQIIGLAMKVQRVLGRGFLESVYRKALLLELRKAGLGPKKRSGSAFFMKESRWAIFLLTFWWRAKSYLS
jgi:GxxExxY protein